MRAMFLYRVAGGADNDDLPESNGRAVINTIYGNTVKWNQLLASGRLVDMGLPSGTLWATSNIDITQEDGFAASPFQYDCTMFSWGNVEGHNTPASGNTFDYNWGGVNAQDPWYEGQPYGDTPGSTLTSAIVANDTQDAARYNLGSLFKMPTSTQFKELVDNCDFVNADGTTVIDDSVTDKRVTVNSVVGIYLKSKINGNLIFFSASGRGNVSLWYNRGANGGYWSASFDSSRDARRLVFGSGGVDPQNDGSRYYGFAVRAVVTPSTTSEIGHNNHKFCLTSNHKNMVDLTTLEYPNIATTTPTVAEVEAWLALNVGTQEYYPYDEGSLISFNGQGVRTVKNNVELDRKPFDVTKVYGKLRGKGNYVQVFTNKDSGNQSISYYGMNFVDNSYYTKEDKIYIDSNTGKLTAIRATRKADLGNATWELYSGQSHTFRTSTYGTTGTDGNPVNIVGYTESTKALTDNSGDLLANFSGGGTRGLRIVNQSLSSSDIVNGKIAALEGVEMVYGLISPNIYTELIYRDNGTDTPLEEIFPIKYKVDKYSTEEVLVPSGDAPTSTSMIADIEYQAR